jgi:alkanesulfonate monooxygenase SsuD/methylene tetrahydromethanopterin reductase-like flavin-dependent oxidoreductase (luciferase family)
VRYSVFSVVDNYASRPRTVGEFYGQLLREIVRAEELGFHAYFVAEHHFHEYGVLPSPPVLLAAAAQRTHRIGLGTAVAVLPFQDPVRAAEDYAVLDQLSAGRLAFGAGSGYLAHEFAGFNIGPWEKRARFDEALSVIETAWRGEPFTHHGLYYHYDDVSLNVLPVQRPVPLWVAILNTEAAYHVGAKGRNLMMIPYASLDDLSHFANVVAEYRRGRADGGFDPDAGDILIAFHTYVAETDAAAVDRARPALDQYVATRLYARRRSLEELDSKGLVLIGEPDTVARRIAAAAGSGMTHVVALANYGGMDAALVDRSTELFACEVMPRVEELIAQTR